MVLEKTTVETLTEIEGVTQPAAERIVATIALHNEFSQATTRRQSEPKPTAIDKFKASNDLDERLEIGRKVAELRINEQGSKPMSWRRIREKLSLRNDEFHKVVRLEDHFKESVVQRIESFEKGWGILGQTTRASGIRTRR